MLYNRSYNDRYELGQIRDEKAKSQLFTNLIQHPDAIKSFYIEHNIKELEFLNFIQSLPLTFYNLKALYIKDLSLNRITHD